LGAAAEIALGGGELKPSGVTNKYKQQVYSSSQGCHTATGTHMPHGITQFYLPPGRGDIPALTSAEAGIRLSDPGVTKGGHADGGGGAIRRAQQASRRKTASPKIFFINEHKTF